MVHRLVHPGILQLEGQRLSAPENHLFSFSSMSEVLASLLGIVGAT